jgi:hypothetical protein
VVHVAGIRLLRMKRRYFHGNILRSVSRKKVECRASKPRAVT